MKKNALLVLVVLISSCASKKDIILFQDADTNATDNVVYALPKIQVNDILDVKISALNPEAAVPYNSQTTTINAAQNMETLKLQGHLVSAEGTINLPILGAIAVAGKSTAEVEKEVSVILESNGHLKSPTVALRILNAKVTILGEVNAPGTYTYTEQTITVPQALGYAGDLSISANRKEVLLIREENGVRKYHKIDLTQSDWFTTPYYTLKQNDVLYVYPNSVKVKSAGFIGNTSTVLSVLSILLTSYVLLTR